MAPLAPKTVAQPLYTPAPEIDLNLKHSAAPQLASLAARLRRPSAAFGAGLAGKNRGVKIR